MKTLQIYVQNPDLLAAEDMRDAVHNVADDESELVVGSIPLNEPLFLLLSG